MEIIVYAINGDIIQIDPFDFEKALEDYEDSKKKVFRIESYGGEIHLMEKRNILRVTAQQKKKS